MMRELSAVLAMGLLFMFALSLQADDDAARAAFEEGKDHFEGRRFLEAAASFRRANKLKPNWKLLYNVGQSEAAAKRYGLALETFERYLAEGGDEIAAGRRDEVLSEVRRLRDMVGSLEVRAPKGAMVIVDEVERGRAPLSGHVIVAAGKEHWVVIKRLDEMILDRMVRVSGGQVLVVEAEGVPETSGREVAPEAETEEEEGEPVSGGAQRRPLRTGGWVTVGLGGALVIGGVVTGGMALSLDKDLEEDCGDSGCPPDLKGDRDRLDVLGVTTDVLIVIGAVTAVAGVVMLVVDSKRKEEGAETALVPAVGPGFAGVSFGRRF